MQEVDNIIARVNTSTSWRNLEQQVRSMYAEHGRAIVLQHVTLCDFDDNTNSNNGLKSLVAILHRVKVYRNEGVDDTDPNMRLAVNNILRAFALGGGGAKIINDITADWIFPMLMDIQIGTTSWKYINMTGISSIGIEFSKWLTRNVKTVQTKSCAFADDGHHFCEGLEHPYACAVEQLNFMSTDIDKDMLANALRNTITLKSFNLQEKRPGVSDGWWSTVMREGLAMNKSVEKCFLSGRYESKAALHGDLLALLSCERDCTYAAFLTAPLDPPDRCSQQQLAADVANALRSNRHAIIINYLGLIVDFAAWKGIIEPLVISNKKIRAIRRAMMTMGGGQSEYSCSILQSYLLSMVYPSNDMLYELLKMNSSSLDFEGMETSE